MMTCQEVLSYLDDLIDDELPPTKSTDMQTHIAHCQSCREEYDRTIRLLTLLKQRKVFTPDETYWDEVTPLVIAKTVEAVQDDVTVQPQVQDFREKRTALIRAVVAAAASLAILFSALVIGSQQSQQLSERDFSSPVFATADLRELLGPRDSGIFTRNDQLQLARGMLLIGSPGVLGRFSGMQELITWTVTE